MSVGAQHSPVMPGLEPGIHVLRTYPKKDVDGRVKPGHDSAYSAACAGLSNLASFISSCRAIGSQS